MSSTLVILLIVVVAVAAFVWFMWSRGWNFIADGANLLLDFIRGLMS